VTGWAGIRDDPPPRPKQAPADEAKPEAAQLGIAKVQTPAGERLAVTLTMFLDPAQARVFAAQVTDAAASLSSSGLVIANGPVPQ
jgi:hypothetical protein